MQAFRGSLAALGRFGVIAVVAVAVFAGSLGLGSGLLSTGAQSSENIRGCVNIYTGALRILSGNGQCSAGERPLNWNSAPDGKVVLDQVQVTNTVRIRTVDQTPTALARAGCPDGYRIVTGGAERAAFSGDDEFYLMASRPMYGDVAGTHGWEAAFKTVDGENAEGIYAFSVFAVCEKLSK